MTLRSADRLAACLATWPCFSTAVTLRPAATDEASCFLPSSARSFAVSGRPLALTGLTAAGAAAVVVSASLGAAVNARAAAQLAVATSAAETLCARVMWAGRGRVKLGM